MPNGTRKKRPSQRGVQAIFTPRTDWKGKAQLATGVLGLLAGVGLWTLLIRPAGGPLGGFQGDNASYMALLVPTAFLLVAGGAGLCTYFLVVRRTRREYYRLESSLYRLEALVGAKGGEGSSMILDADLAERKTFKLQVSKSLAAALTEGVLLIILYYGLVAEYKSNVHMQEWVRANIPFGNYLLNDLAVVLLAGSMLAVLIFQIFLRRFSKANRRD